MAQKDKQEDQVALLTSLLENYEHILAYQPLRTEVPISHFIPEGIVVHTIPPRASLYPVEVAQSVQAQVSSGNVVILIPGRRFDASGTRHGQGGGWYDRFLAEVPRQWLRIGFCYDDQLSPTPLRRESWDQAMDYVVVVDRNTGAVSMYTSDAYD